MASKYEKSFDVNEINSTAIDQLKRMQSQDPNMCFNYEDDCGRHPDKASACISVFASGEGVSIVTLQNRAAVAIYDAFKQKYKEILAQAIVDLDKEIAACEAAAKIELRNMLTE